MENKDFLINGYELVNSEKIDRAKKGVVYAEKGRVDKVGGLSDNYTPEQLLAEYDRLGGLIKKNGVKVKSGSFYDFDNKKPFEKPNVKFVSEVEGEQVELTEEEAEAVNKAKKKINEIKKEKVKKIKKLEQ